MKIVGAYALQCFVKLSMLLSKSSCSASITSLANCCACCVTSQPQNQITSTIARSNSNTRSSTYHKNTVDPIHIKTFFRSPQGMHCNDTMDVLEQCWVYLDGLQTCSERFLQGTTSSWLFVQNSQAWICYTRENSTSEHEGLSPNPLQSLFKPLGQSPKSCHFSCVHHRAPQNVTLTLKGLTTYSHSSTRNHINEIEEKTPQQHFEVSTKTFMAITFWESLKTCTFIMNSSNELPWLPTDFISFQTAKNIQQDWNAEASVK